MENMTNIDIAQKGRVTQKWLNRQRGFTLIELLIVVLFIGTFVGIMWNRQSAPTEGQRQSQWSTDLMAIVGGTRKKFIGASTTGAAGTDITSQLVGAGVFPGDMAPSAGGPFNPWNGAVNVLAAVTSFQVKSTAMSMQGCIDAVIEDTSDAADIGLTNISINGTSVPVTAQIGLGVAQPDCNGAGDTNTLIYTFNMR